MWQSHHVATYLLRWDTSMSVGAGHTYQVGHQFFDASTKRTEYTTVQANSVKIFHVGQVGFEPATLGCKSYFLPLSHEFNVPPDGR